MARSSRRGADAIREAVSLAQPADAADDGGGSRDLRLARKLLNDSGNADRLQARHGRNLLFVDQLGRFWWTGSHWSGKNGAREWHLAAQKTAAAIWTEVAALDAEADRIAADDPDAGKPLRKQAHQLRDWATESGNRARLNGMQDVLSPRAERHVDELDADPFLLNVQNGTLELGSKRDPVAIRLRRHARLDYITRISPVGYDPEATSFLFEAFLARILPDKEVRHWVQRWFGYCLTADYSAQKLALFYGQGNNGKGVLSKLVQWVMGDYAATLQFASLIDDRQKRGSEASPDWARLPGVRAVFAGEPKKGARLDDGLVKQLTGGDDMPVRKLNREFFDLRPTFKFTLSMNNKPQIRDDTHGMWRRVNLVPFNEVIPDQEIDPHLLDKLKSEGPGVLNWLLDGYRLWREQGLSAPQAILAATAEYRMESDVFGQFVAQAIDPNPGGRVRSGDLYDCYKGYCEAMESRPMSSTKFGIELTKKGYRAVKDGVMYRVDVRFSDRITWDWAKPLW